MNNKQQELKNGTLGDALFRGAVGDLKSRAEMQNSLSYRYEESQERAIPDIPTAECREISKS